MSSPTPTQVAIGPQPDFDEAEQSFDSIKVQFTRLQNIPAIVQGDLIVQLLRQIRTDIREMKEELTTNLLASNANSVARTQNAKTSKRTDRLMPLVAYATNAPVNGFPGTPGDISQLGGAVLNNILNDLKLPTRGSVSEKRRILVEHIGCFDIV